MCADGLVSATIWLFPPEKRVNLSVERGFSEQNKGNSRVVVSGLNGCCCGIIESDLSCGNRANRETEKPQRMRLIFVEISKIWSVMVRIKRSVVEPLRDSPDFDERWNAEDKGLITCWEVGRELREKEPDLARRVELGELPVLGWKGGIDKKIKTSKKYGSLKYLAQWQGLRGEDLNVDLNAEISLVCSKIGMQVTFTGDLSKYANG